MLNMTEVHPRMASPFIFLITTTDPPIKEAIIPIKPSTTHILMGKLENENKASIANLNNLVKDILEVPFSLMSLTYETLPCRNPIKAHIPGKYLFFSVRLKK